MLVFLEIMGPTSGAARRQLKLPLVWGFVWLLGFVTRWYLVLLAQISSKMPQMFVHGDFSFQCSDFFQGAQYISLFSVLISSKMPKPFVHRYLSIQCSDFFQDAQYISLFSVLISTKIPIIFDHRDFSILSLSPAVELKLECSDIFYIFVIYQTTDY